ncbi:hypothetical protein RRG08_048768 [Elysia crispata]|uniref:Uncharacterized protein n=1 Tax=Elysia crispata TaxID=231223 RepID=A0AAE1AMP6_9GAST|nr:hypothetical protein RRG08_048768 [Elysia crispata]
MRASSLSAEPNPFRTLHLCYGASTWLDAVAPLFVSGKLGYPRRNLRTPLFAVRLILALSDDDTSLSIYTRREDSLLQA